MRGNKDNSIWLYDILESIVLIQQYLSDVTEEEFFNSSGKAGLGYQAVDNNWRSRKKFGQWF